MIVGIKNSLLFFITLFGCSFTFAQKKHVSLKDSLDKKFDMSDYLIDANGFIPIPLIITEPAVGGFGGAMIPVFINKNHPYQDSIKGQLVTTHVAPDITGGLALYTVNNTWALAAFRSGILIKSRIKYVIGGAYANINVSFYKTLSQLGEKELKFNLKTMPLLLQATKRIGFSHWYAGLKYLFVKVDASYKGDTILNSVAKSLELDRVVSQLGGIVELDSRDNIFTPDKGIKLHTDAVISDNFLGSDYDFWKLNMYMYAYTPVSKKIVAGLRIDGQQVLNDAPFYMLPYITMRGIPALRYQGNTALLSEIEMRWDIKPRWSLMGFSGAGKAFNDWNKFDAADWVWSYGTGFRYLIARKFKLRAGIDVAHGPGTWAYYIVFGSNWVK
ncbi:MAG: hypothetical protein E6H07_16685 [Bacteroidetes bacterium]|nr:MAG: hypothetical protein E6H07_16685 [Bacteroidota bacterium]